VDAATKQLTAYTYFEDHAGKGGNNVTSMLWLMLKQKGIVAPPDADDADPLKELNFVFDNCGGQNKNRMVLRFLVVLVKRKICKLARAIFLVRGHTKNDCDRSFNLLKKHVRHENIYTPEELFISMNKAEDVEAIQVPEDGFCDWDSWENQFMSPKVAKTNSYHVFEVDAERENGNKMYTRTHDGAEEVEQWIVKKDYRDNSECFKTDPKIERPIGIQNIKWIELYKKWRPLVPKDRWPKFRYYNEDPGLARTREVSESTKQSKNKRQKRQRTTHSSDELPHRKMDTSTNEPDMPMEQNTNPDTSTDS
jgi:hypothetical protein